MHLQVVVGFVIMEKIVIHGKEPYVVFVVIIEILLVLLALVINSINALVQILNFSLQI